MSRIDSQPLSEPSAIPAHGKQEEPSLTQRTARGFVWMVIQTIGSKVVTTVGQIILAWLLTKSDFGLMALAGTATAFASLSQQLGLNKILIQRQSRFKLFANAAFWIGLTSGFVTSLAMIIAAPTAAFVYKDSRLIGLILLLAIAPPLDSLLIVPTAYQNLKLQFRLLATVGLVCNIVTIVLTVFFAYLGFGAYSFALPRPIVSAGQALYFWKQTPVRIKRNPQFRRWRYLAADAGFLLLSALAWTFMSQGDYMALGALHTPEVVGVYYFAFNLSTQPVQLLVVNLTNVLGPVLSRMQNESARQTAAFVRTAKVLAFVGLPLCFVQSLLAEPVLRLLFGTKWAPAVLIFQILSAGMGYAMIFGLGTNLLTAQGRFGLQCWLAIASSAAFLAAVFTASYFGEGTNVAIAVSLFYVLFGFVTVYVSVAKRGSSLAEVLGIFALPTVASGIPFVPLFLAIVYWGNTMSHWLQICLFGPLYVGLYVAALIIIFPTQWMLIKQQMREIIARRLPATSTGN